MTSSSIQEAVHLLRAAETPSRALDQTVAHALGWSAHVIEKHDELTGITKRQTVWADQHGREAPRAPFYTSSLHTLYKLAATLASRGGVSWEDGMGTARLGEGPYIQAQTPEIALCIAILLELDARR